MPGARAGRTTALDINNAGQVTGTYDDPTGGYHGFPDTQGSYVGLDAPGAYAGQTTAAGINNAGQVTGYFNA